MAFISVLFFIFGRPSRVAAQEVFFGRPAVVAGLPQRLKLEGILEPLLASQVDEIREKISAGLRTLKESTVSISKVHHVQLTAAQQLTVLSSVKSLLESQGLSAADIEASIAALRSSLSELKLEIAIDLEVKVQPWHARVRIAPAYVPMLDQFDIEEVMNASSQRAEASQQELIEQIRDPLLMNRPRPSISRDEVRGDLESRSPLRRALLEGTADVQVNIKKLQIKLVHEPSKKEFVATIDPSKLGVLPLSDQVRVSASFSAEEDWDRKRPRFSFEEYTVLAGKGRLISTEEQWTAGGALLSSLPEGERESLRTSGRKLFIIERQTNKPVELLWDSPEARAEVRRLLDSGSPDLNIGFGVVRADLEANPYRISIDQLKTNLQRLHFRRQEAHRLVDSVVGEQVFGLAVGALASSPLSDRITETSERFTDALSALLLERSPRVLIFSTTAAPETLRIAIDNEENRSALERSRVKGELVFSARGLIPLSIKDFKIDSSESYRLKGTIKVNELMRLELQEVTWFPGRNRLRKPLDQIIPETLSLENLNAVLQVELENSSLQFNLPYEWDARADAPRLKAESLEVHQELLQGIRPRQLTVETLSFDLQKPMTPQLNRQLDTLVSLYEEKAEPKAQAEVLSKGSEYVLSQIQLAFQKLSAPDDPGKSAAIAIRETKPEFFFADLNIKDVVFPEGGLKCEMGATGFGVDWNDGQLEIMDYMWEEAYTWSKGKTWVGDSVARPSLREQQPWKQFVCRAETPETITLEFKNIRTKAGDVSDAVVTLTRRKNARPLLIRFGLVKDVRTGAQFLIPDRENFLTILQDYDLSVSFPPGTEVDGASGVGAIANGVQDLARQMARSSAPKDSSLMERLKMPIFAGAAVTSALIQKEELNKVRSEIDEFWQTKKPQIATVLFRQLLRAANGNPRGRQYQAAQRADSKVSLYEFFPLSSTISTRDLHDVGVMGRLERELESAGTSLDQVIARAPEQIAARQDTLNDQVELAVQSVSAQIENVNQRMEASVRRGENHLTSLTSQLPSTNAPEAEIALHEAIRDRIQLPIEAQLNESVLSQVRNHSRVNLSNAEMRVLPFQICSINQKNDIQTLLASFDSRSNRNNRSRSQEYPADDIARLVSETGNPAIAVSFEFANSALILNEENFRKRAENLIKYENGKNGRRRFGIDGRFRLDSLRPRLISIDGKAHLVVEASYRQPASVFQHLVPVVTQVGDLPFMIGKSDARPFRDGGNIFGQFPDLFLQPVMAPFLSVDQKSAQFIIPLESEFLPPRPGERNQRLVFRPNREFSRKVLGDKRMNLGTAIFRSISETLVNEQSIEIPFDPQIPGLKDQMTFEVVSFESLNNHPEWIVLSFKAHQTTPAPQVLDIHAQP